MNGFFPDWPQGPQGSSGPQDLGGCTAVKFSKGLLPRSPRTAIKIKLYFSDMMFLDESLILFCDVGDGIET